MLDRLTVGSTEIVPGIHQIRLPLHDRMVDHVNVHLIRGSDGWVLIDSGWDAPGCFEDLVGSLGSLGVGLDDICMVIYTHIHPDHFGLAGVLKERSRAKVIVHPEGKDLIETRYFRKGAFLDELAAWHLANGGTMKQANTVRTNASGMIGRVVPVAPDGLLDGEKVSTGVFDLNVIYTPGHDSDHVCLYEPSNRLLFSGDHILPETIPHIGHEVDSPHNPLGEYLDSLDVISRMDIDLVLPGHEAAFGAVTERIEELIAYYRDLNAEVLRVIGGGRRTAYDTCREIRWPNGMSNWAALPVVAQVVLAARVFACLRMLSIDGKVTAAVDKNGVTVYNAA